MGNNYCKNRIKECCCMTQYEQTSKKGFTRAMMSYEMSNLTASSTHIQDYTYFYDNPFFKNIPILFDTDKFIMNYPNYKSDQIKMEKHWKKSDLDFFVMSPLRKSERDCLSAKWKFLIRRGIPLKQLRFVLIYLFGLQTEENEKQYQMMANLLFKGKKSKHFKNCPLFSEFTNLDKILNNNLLNNEGIDALKRICWVLRETISYLEYSPMIINIIGILLMFLTESETYFIVKNIIEFSHGIFNNNSKKSISKCMRWYLTLNLEDFDKVCWSLFENVQEKSETFKMIYDHFLKIKFDFIELFKDWISSIFLQTLPLANEILRTKDPETVKIIIFDNLKELSLKDFNLLLKESFNLIMTDMNEKSNNNSIKLSPLHKSTKMFYRPRVNTDSNIISEEDFETIWDWLPTIYKLHDAHMIWSTINDGYSLQRLYKKCEEYEGYSMILIIQNDYKWIFGAYCNSMLNLSCKEYIGTDETFLFTLSPVENIIISSQNNNNHLYCNVDYFSFGAGGGGVAFQINSDLSTGHTYCSETYNNIKFNGQEEISQFNVLALEVYAII